MGKYPSPGDAPTPSIRNIGNTSNTSTTGSSTRLVTRHGTIEIVPSTPHRKYTQTLTLLPRGYSDADIAELVDEATRYVPLGLTDILSLTNQSNIAYTNMNLAGYVTQKTIAVNLKLTCRDDASSTDEAYLAVKYPNDSSASLVAKAYHINNVRGIATGICAVNNKRQISYTVGASGAGTADASISLLGFIELII